VNLTIPARYRKVVYVVGVIAGVVTLGLGILDPSIASEASERAQSVTDWLTSLAGVVGAAGGVLALLHLTVDKPTDPDALEEQAAQLLTQANAARTAPDDDPGTDTPAADA
jgi:hypothetical protein